jgi:hypothetical protein
MPKVMILSHGDSDQNGHITIFCANNKKANPKGLAFKISIISLVAIMLTG